MKNPMKRWITRAAVVVAVSGCAADAADELDELGEDVEVSVSALTVGGGHDVWFNSGSYADAQTLKDLMIALRNSKTDVDAMASVPGGGWIVAWKFGAVQGGNVPSQLAQRVRDIQRAGQRVRAIDVNAELGWIAVGDTVVYTGGAVPAGVAAKVTAYQTAGYVIRDVDITTTAWIVLGPGSLVAYTAGLDADLRAFVYDRRASKRRVEQIDVGFDGRWVVVADQEPATESVSTQLRDVLLARARNRNHTSRLMLGDGDSFVLYSHGTVVPDLNHPMEAIEYDLAGTNLWQRMQQGGVPGLSIAIVENNKVTYARGYGVLRADEDAHVLATTPFDLASLSKYLGSLVMLRLGAQGLVDFNADILTDPGLHIDLWQDIPSSSPGTTQVPSNVPLPAGMTVRRLLHHNAGIRAIPSPAFPQDSWGEAGWMQPWALLLGGKCDVGNDCGWKNGYVWTNPMLGIGGGSTYSSGNFMVAQAVATDTTGKSGSTLLHELFFDPMGLSDTSAALPPPASFVDRTAWQHLGLVPATTRNIYPWVFAGGVISSARDYAELMIIALNGGKDSDAIQRVTPNRINEMLVGVNLRGYGLRLEGASAAEGTDVTFLHDGRHSGQGARTWMCGNPTRDEGIVILANTASFDDSDAGSSDEIAELIRDILNAYVDVMGWPAGLNCR